MEDLIQTVRRSQQIPIHTIGNAISKQHSPWLSTKDKIYTYAKRRKQYAGFRLQHVTKIQYYYTNKILFQTEFENVDHLDHITVHFHSNQWVIHHVSSNESITVSALQVISHNIRKIANHNLLKRSAAPGKRSCQRNQVQINARYGVDGPQARITSYNDHKYMEYREWWNNNRPTPELLISTAYIKRHDYGLIPKGHKKEAYVLLQHITQQDHPYQRTIGQIQSIRNLESLAKAITEGKAIGESDTSVNSNNEGFHAYIIESRDESCHIIGSGPVDCDEDDIESTRSEMAGVLAILLVLQIICEEYSIIKGEFQIYCDNNEAINIK